MAMRLVRFRRALAAPPPALRRRRPPSAAPAPAPSPSRPAAPPPAATALRPRSSSAAAAAASLFFSRSLAYDASGYNDGDKIDPDTVLFEGCDFNPWLITMDFPKDPNTTPEEMVRTYEETCAKGLNISKEHLWILILQRPNSLRVSEIK